MTVGHTSRSLGFSGLQDVAARNSDVLARQLEPGDLQGSGHSDTDTPRNESSTS